MRIVRGPQQGLDAKEGAHLDADRILLEAEKDILVEAIAGDRAPFEPSPAHPDGLLGVEVVHAPQAIRRPRHLELDGPHLELGIALEDPSKDQRGQGDADVVLFVRAFDDVHQRGVVAVGPRPPPPGARMQAQRHGEVLGRCPDGLIHGVIIAVLQGAQGDQRSSQAEPGGPLEFPYGLLYVVHIQHGDALEPMRVRLTEVGQPVVIGAADGREQGAIRGSVSKVEMATFTLPVQRHTGSQTSQ